MQKIELLNRMNQIKIDGDRDGRENLDDKN